MEELIRELEELKNKYAELEEKNSGLELERQKLEKKVAYYEESLRLSRHRQYASSSEKSKADSHQLLLFDEAENESDVKKPEPTVCEITYTRRSRKGGSKPEDDFEDLPTERVEYTLSEEERSCPELSGMRRQNASYRI